MSFQKIPEWTSRKRAIFAFTPRFETLDAPATHLILLIPVPPTSPSTRRHSQVNKVMLAKEHRPFNPRSEAHQNFLRRQLQRLDKLQGKHPKLMLDDERAFFQSHLLEVATPQRH